MNHRRVLSVLAVSLSLAGCQGTTPYRHVVPYRANPADLHVVLERPLTVPAGAATVRLQAGKPVAMNAVEETDPYCIFEISTVSDRSQTVAPGSYAVRRIEREVVDFAGMPVSPMAAALGAASADGPSQMYFVTEFSLMSARQPAVRSLRCQSNELGITSPNRHFLSLDEMKHAVGGYFSFVSAP